jgi:hypothetical protein
MVAIAYLRRRDASSVGGARDPSNLQDFMDWMTDDVDRKPATEFVSVEDIPTDLESSNVLRRGLALLGLAATSPRQARTVRDPELRRLSPEKYHPATGNEEIADEVVHLRRVSEEEEAERYFAAFSYNQ